MNSSLKYLSFNSPNTSRLNGNPLAESTAIGSPMVQQDASFRGNQKRKTLSPLTNASKHRQSSIQIEPHVLTNAQSRGIVKRLVSYYDESQGEPDKKYVYNRVGDFPIVQLRKTEIKRNLVRSSSVRIAPPTKTVFNRDIRAAIIRSNSMQLGASVPKLQPTKMRAKDDLHQIITNHEPLPNDEIVQSAKSVLDALEKNCRKRINNEELTLDRTKRICATEAVDGPSNREFIPIVPQSAKRGRDEASPPNQRGDSPNSQLRKRLRTRNNALLSSLSSSHFRLIPSNSQPPSPAVQVPSKAFQFTEPSTTNEEVERTEKRLRETTVSSEVEKAKPPQEKRLHLFNTRTDEIAPIFRSRAADDDDDEEFKVNFVKPRAKPLNYEESDEVPAIENRKLSAMLSGLSGAAREPSKDTVDKPAPEPTHVVVSTAAASISFTTSTTTSTAAPITTPVSSTLSMPGTNTTLLLTSQVKTSEPAALPTTSVAVETTKAPMSFSFGASTSSTTLTVPSTPVKTTVSGRVSPLATLSTPETSNPTSVPSIDPNKSLITFTPIAKSAPTTTAPPALISLAPAVTSTPSLGATPSFSFGASKEAPKLGGGFSFGGSSTSSSSVPLFGSTAPAVSTAPSAIQNNTPAPTAVSTAPPSFSFPTASTNSFNFGAKPSASVAPTITGISAISGISSLSSNSGGLSSTVSFVQRPETTTASGVGFSFGGNSATPATTASSGFSFGSSQNLVTSTPAVTTASSFSFGATTNSAFGASAAPAFGAPAAPAFGQPQSQTPVTAPPVFGQSSSATPSFGQPAVTPAPSFTGFTQPSAAPQPAATGMFSFGQKTAPAVAATTTSSFAFGSSTPAVTSSSTFSFGQSNPMQPAATTASSGIFGRLGDKQPEAKPAFSFGGGNQQQASTPSMFGSTNNSAPAPSSNMFGSMSTPSFGQANNNQQPSNNMFGSNSTPSNDFAAKPASGGIFSFGGPTNNTPVPTPAAAPSGIFSFGGGSSTPNNAPQASNVFGASNPGQNVSASFTFKPSTGTVSSNPSPNVFGQPQNAAAPPSYQFGGTTANVSFTFGQSSATPQVAQQSAGFNFSGPQSAPTAGAFNFQGAVPAVNAPQPGGMFNIGTGGNQQRRPIRQAMRRMK